VPFDFGKIINSAKEAGAFLGFADGGGAETRHEEPRFEAQRAQMRGP